ncbi:hypothetical protein EVAR_29736_1 [Eumeta japonica]|uniref:Uncharacterized protein n=1 Tax=Eumeta variegata TaxID=151549 RepID=A0A4C1W0S8_EUMVA|nr:hypothetical protein EVAR_29736_1 [Eumeta japonica]
MFEIYYDSNATLSTSDPPPPRRTNHVNQSILEFVAAPVSTNIFCSRTALIQRGNLKIRPPAPGQYEIETLFVGMLLK